MVAGPVNPKDKKPVLRIRDVYPGPEFFHPGFRVKKITDPHQKIQVFLTQKNVSKLLENWMFIADPDLFSHPGSRGKQSTGSQIRNIG
jgi:hypothetical protein